MTPAEHREDRSRLQAVGRSAWGGVAALAAAAAAGPWPSLPPLTLVWRVPLAIAAVVAARRLGLRLWKVSATGLFVVTALALDGTCPAVLPSAEVARSLARAAGGVTVALGRHSQTQQVRSLLSGGGGEAQPERPFSVAEEVLSDLPAGIDTLVLVDDRSLPVAWVGSAARMPVELRPLGERTTVAEPGVGSVWIWWREPVFDAGRPVGAILSGTALPADGARRVLGVWAGRAGLIVPRLTGGTAVRLGTSRGALGVEVRRTRAAAWTLPGLALLPVAVVLAGGAPVAALAAALAAGVAWVTLLGYASPGWWAVLGVAALAALVTRLPSIVAVRLALGVILFALGWLQSAVLAELHVAPAAVPLAAPGLVVWAAVVVWTLLLRGAPPPRRHPSAWVAVAAWAPLVAGVLLAEPLLLGAGAATVALWGLPRRPTALAALASAALLVSGGEAAQRRTLVGVTEKALARSEDAAAPARVLLASLAEGSLARLVREMPGEQVVSLGRLAHQVDFSESLPGASLVLVDPSGEPAGTWGPLPPTVGPETVELASRPLIGSWRVAVLTPAPPQNVLSALDAEGIGIPVAAFDRAGAPTARGAIFRPLTPDTVGRALAAQRSWGRVRVGEREFDAYLRAIGDYVLAVPWDRPPPSELALLLAALVLWGAAPVVVWEQRPRVAAWWRERRTFAGRLRLLTAAAVALPVVLLSQFLPQQWARQRELVRLELGRAVSRPLASLGWQHEMGFLVNEMGGTVAVYRAGELTFSSRPDLVAEGRVPSLPPAEAFVRAVRGWREPVVTGAEETNVFAPMRSGEEPLVVAVLGLQMGATGVGPSPAEWFAVTGLWGLVFALAVAERLERRLATPLRQLVGAVTRLEEGRPVEEFPLGGDEDVAALARGFQTMARTVQRREEDLRREKDLLEGVLETLSAAVLVADEEGRVELANPAARQLLQGEASFDALAASFGVIVGEMLHRAASGERVTETVHPPAAPEASWRVTVLPLAAAGARRLLAVLEDLSDVSRAERLASLAELARIVAHEVKNPLTPIRLWAEELQVSLQRGPAAVAEVARAAAEQILDRVEQLREVAQGFSNLVALERWEPERVDLARLAKEVAEEYGVLAQRGVSLRLEGSERAEVVGDPRWLGRALRHLLDNSARALGGKPGRIVVEVGEAGTEVSLAVRDTAGGVPEANLARLFAPHFSTTSQGSGLGLAVVDRVARRAGGRAEARNTGEGLEVVLILPASPAPTAS
jgi:signal transduction histidine kinase